MAFSTDLFAPKDAALFGGLIDRYRPLPSIHDEMMDANGSVRPSWVRFLRCLAQEGRESLERRFISADRYLRESGVFYRVYDNRVGEERAWPLSHVPLLIDDADWRELAEGLIERAVVMEKTLADLYGRAELVSSGVLPGAAVAGSPEFMRPLAGVTPRGGYLSFYAVDVGRSPSGRWWVIGDRTQAPSGAGYALENRLAMMRVMPQTYETLNIERLAGFFQGLRAHLSGKTLDREGRVGVLTPGPMNETYFEHSYLARYLGFVLVEGEDLTVRDDEVYIRTVSGLRRADVLWRRLDADFADPLELNSLSHLGVPGLVSAVRSGQLMLVNALGSGLVESNALLSFLNPIAHHFNGVDLKLPHTATWWCGQHVEREWVLEALDDVVVAPAFGTRVPGVLENGPVLVANLSQSERANLVDAIRTRGADFVAQEVVNLSTTPVWVDGRLEPRPFTLRVFMARTDAGWTVMPGGFARVGDRIDARAVTMQKGGRTADVCVMSRKPVAKQSLLPRPDAMAIRRSAGSLPSRAADNLLWLGRYTERLESILRLIRALAGQFTGAEDLGDDAPNRIVDILTAWEALPEKPLRTAPGNLAAIALFGHDLPNGVAALARRARGTASIIRDRLSPDAWRAISDLVEVFEKPDEGRLMGDDAFEAVEDGLRLLASFSGLVQENMNQLLGWRFLQIGRRIERGLGTCRFARQFGDKDAGASGLDILLALADSQITYRSRYVMVAARAPVLDLVLLDDRNPRSVAYQVERLREHLAALPGRAEGGLLDPAGRFAERLATDMRVKEAVTIDADFIIGVERGLMTISDEIAARYFTHRRRRDEATADDHA